MTTMDVIPSLREILQEKSPTIALRSSIVVVLSWIAVSDGQIENAEVAFIKSVASDLGTNQFVSALVSIGLTARPRDLGLACCIIRDIKSLANRRLLLELATGALISDGRVRFSELYILQLLAELLAISEVELRSIFERVAGRPMPSVADPSRREYWNRSRRESTQASTSNPTRVRALSILGLEGAPTDAEVREAYRRLARVHHPDRFQTLGPEASKTAHEIFIRIRWAYEQLGGA